jgi:hypothetical protein
MCPPLYMITAICNLQKLLSLDEEDGDSNELGRLHELCFSVPLHTVSSWHVF